MHKSQKQETYIPQLGPVASFGYVVEALSVASEIQDLVTHSFFRLRVQLLDVMFKTLPLGFALCVLERYIRSVLAINKAKVFLGLLVRDGIGKWWEQKRQRQMDTTYVVERTGVGGWQTLLEDIGQSAKAIRSCRCLSIGSHLC
jgi:hypothetical protein